MSLCPVAGHLWDLVFVVGNLWIMHRPIKIYSGVGVVKESSRQTNLEGCSSLPYVECMEEGEYEGF